MSSRSARASWRALPFATLLYARVDLIRAADGGPRLLELELTEPSLFFPYGPGSAARLLSAARCAGCPRASGRRLQDRVM